MTQFQTRLDIAILPPYTPSTEERADPKLYAANVRRLYSQAMGLPLAEQVPPARLHAAPCRLPTGCARLGAVPAGDGCAGGPDAGSACTSAGHRVCSAQRRTLWVAVALGMIARKHSMHTGSVVDTICACLCKAARGV